MYQPKNFIKQNIQNVRGRHKPPITFQDQSRYRSMGRSKPKPHQLSINQKSQYKHITSQYNKNSPEKITDRLSELQKRLSHFDISQNQSVIVSQISQIKNDIKMIKSHLMMQSGGKRLGSRYSKSKSKSKSKQKQRSFHQQQYYEQQQYQRQHTHSSGNEDQDEQSIYNSKHFLASGSRHQQQGHYDQQQSLYPNPNLQQRMRSHGSEGSMKQSKISKSGGYINSYNNSNTEIPLPRMQSLEEWLAENQRKHNSLMNNKHGQNIKAVFPMLKQYKLQGPQFGSIFYGYSKRTSQAVAVKYIQNPTQLNHLIEVYDRMWKNIPLAKWPCINRILDVKTLDNNFLIMQRNKTSIAGLPPKSVLIDLFKCIQFIHECGYLYRNFEPEHFMLNEKGQLVIIDFKRAKRYIDIKGHMLQVSDSVFNGSTFASNNQVRGQPQGRKDDLESLGYFALLMLRYDIPWHKQSKQQVIKMRHHLTLSELFNNQSQWVEYMATVIRTGRNERPDYKRLLGILESL